MSNYIKVEDVQKIMNEMYEKIHGANYIGILKIGLGKVNSLPSINLDDYRKRKIVCGDPFPPRDR